MYTGTQKLDLSAFRPALLDYTFNPRLGGFEHGFERDLQVFVLWEKSKEQWSSILEDLNSRFKLLYCARVEWPVERADNNFLRLYGMPPEPRTPASAPSKRRELVGGGPFMLIVLEDADPVYVYDRTFSKKVELVNRAVVEAKSHYRAITGGGFRVHSSNSLGEFFRDGTLLLGAERLEGLLSRHEAYSGEPEQLSVELAGAKGWPTMRALFQHLQRTCPYVVLRNFEQLPNALAEGDGDLDVLCVDAHDLAAIANARVVVDASGKFDCETEVGGQPLRLDVRVVGDGYYDDRWQLRMLAAAHLWDDCVWVLSPEDHFFSLAYHAKVHKRSVKNAYRSRLRQLGGALGLAAYKDADFTDDDTAAGMLAGFLASHAYRCTMPLDVWVQRNGAFVARLHSEGLLWQRERSGDRARVLAMLARVPFLRRIRHRLSAPVTSVYQALKRYSWRNT